MSIQESITNNFSFDDQSKIKEMMNIYQRLWQDDNQTNFLKSKIPKTDEDFEGVYSNTVLKDIFTLDKLRYGKGFNCNNLYITTIRDIPYVLVYSSLDHMVIHPVGEPGRDLKVSGFRVSHLMVVSRCNGPATMNELLPSNRDELNDLKTRLDLGQKAYEALRLNTPISECGELVNFKAKGLGIPPDTGLRDFMVKQIMNFDETFRSGIPGYKLFNSNSDDIAGDEDKVKSLSEKVFKDESLSIVKL